MAVEEPDPGCLNVALPGGIHGTDLAFDAPDALRERLLEGRPGTRENKTVFFYKASWTGQWTSVATDEYNLLQICKE